VLKFTEFLTERAATLFHGTNMNFKEFSKDKARVANDFYGGGVAYFTDDKNVAWTYGKSMTKTKKEGQPIVMTVQTAFHKTFDIDDQFSNQDLVNLLPADIEEFARGAGLLKMGTNKYEVIAKLKAGKMTLTGKQVFMGLSNGMNQTAKAREFLISKGYDSLRYNGGENMGQKHHNVYIAWTNNGINILKREALAAKKVAA
jgi:hypothetical protein